MTAMVLVLVAILAVAAAVAYAIDKACELHDDIAHPNREPSQCSSHDA